MADVIEFGEVKRELNEASAAHMMQVLSRGWKWFAFGNYPSLLVLTDESIYYGGTEITGRKFSRIRLEDMKSVRLAGVLFWRSVEIEYTHKNKKARVYFCPFKGSPGRPDIDLQELEDLRSLLVEYIKRRENEQN